MRGMHASITANPTARLEAIDKCFEAYLRRLPYQNS
jgi:hypothetical protein